jgi:hypothetical protein
MGYPDLLSCRPHSSLDPFGATLSPGEGIFPPLPLRAQKIVSPTLFHFSRENRLIE